MPCFLDVGREMATHGAKTDKTDAHVFLRRFLFVGWIVTEFYGNGKASVFTCR